MKPAKKSKTLRDEKIKGVLGLITAAVGLFRPELVPTIAPAVAGAVMVADAIRGAYRRYQTSEPIGGDGI